MMRWMNGGNAAAWNVWPVVSSRITPVAKSTETSSPFWIACAASGHSRIGKPMLIELR